MRGAHDKAETATHVVRALNWFAATPPLNGRIITKTVRHALIISLFTRIGSLVLHGCVTVGVGLVLAWWLGSWMALAWSTANGLLAALRIVLALRFIKSPRRVGGSIERWAHVYVVTGLLSAAMLGGLAACAMLATDRTVAMPVVACVVGVAGILACRNAALPHLAVAQIMLSAVPLGLSALFVPEHFYRVECVTNLIFVLGLKAVTDNVYRDVAGMLLATEDNARLARNDALTGVANRRHFDEMLDRRLQTHAGGGAGFALALIDIDHFKLFNDHYGHLAGDACLQTVAHVLAGCMREGDALARYGGEEFAVLIAGGDVAGAEASAQRLCANVRAASIAHAARNDGVAIVTVSVGVVGTDGAYAALSPASLLDLADKALYQAKRSGRNRVCVAGTIPASGLPLPAVSHFAAESPSLELLRRSAILPEKAALLRQGVSLPDTAPLSLQLPPPFEAPPADRPRHSAP